MHPTHFPILTSRLFLRSLNPGARGVLSRTAFIKAVKSLLSDLQSTADIFCKPLIAAGDAGWLPGISDDGAAHPNQEYNSSMALAHRDSLEPSDEGVQGKSQHAEERAEEVSSSKTRMCQPWVLGKRSFGVYA